MATDKISRNHGSTGTEPPNGSEFQSGERPEQSHFDWFWYTVTNKINSIIDDIIAVENGDVTVGDATYAENAGNVENTYKGNDIDSDGDGVVDQANLATEARMFELRTSDPTNPDGGQVWIREDL